MVITQLRKTVSRFIAHQANIFKINFKHINQFVPNVLLLFPLKTSENLTVFLCFQGVEKGCIRDEWVKPFEIIVTFHLNTSHLNCNENEMTVSIWNAKVGLTHFLPMLHFIFPMLPSVFWRFQGVQKCNIGWIWVKYRIQRMSIMFLLLNPQGQEFEKLWSNSFW